MKNQTPVIPEKYSTKNYNNKNLISLTKKDLEEKKWVGK